MKVQHQTPKVRAVAARSGSGGNAARGKKASEMTLAHPGVGRVLEVYGIWPKKGA